MLSLIMFTRGKQLHNKAFMVSQNLQVWERLLVREGLNLEVCMQLSC